MNDTTSILKFVWWSFLSRFLLLGISITISPCSLLLLLLHFCAIVYCTLIYQVCQVMSYISFQVLIQVIFILFIAAHHSLHWRLTVMQFIPLPCALMIISMITISFQVKSFNDGIFLVDPVMSSTCVLCISGTRHMPSSQSIHLLNFPPCYANTFLNICFCIILNTYFLTDCLTTIYYIVLLLFYPDIRPSSFYSPTSLSQARRGEGVIQDSHLGLISMNDWDLRLTRLCSLPFLALWPKKESSWINKLF